MINYLIMDVDGTLTDGKIYMGPSGETMKAFSVKDGYVINSILKPRGIIPVIITARNSSIVQNRCNELGITEVYQGKMDKLKILIENVGKKGLGNCAYFGDDILDLKCMTPIKEAGGIVGCPSDAVSEVKAIADYVCVNRAGEAALREFSEWLIRPKITEDEIRKRVAEASDYLENNALSGATFHIGKKIVVNDNFFYSVQSYMTQPSTECRFESHRNYIDIQIIISGKEVVEIADIARLNLQEEYDEEKDVMFWRTPFRAVKTILSVGDIVVLYPENAHRGAVSITTPEHVIKVVGKVKL